MFEKPITYTNYKTKKEVTRTFYFNLTKTELIELEVYYEDGLEDALNRIIAAEDRKTLIAEFQRIILNAYGEIGPDGESFIKVDSEGNRLSDAFRQHAAFDVLFLELATDDNAAAEFVLGTIPEDVAKAYAETGQLTTTPTDLAGAMPPPPPAAPTSSPST